MPALLKELGKVDVFIHDSLHTVRNMRFEMDQIGKVLSADGVMIVDDVHNQSFRDFVRDSPGMASMVCRSGDGIVRATCPSDLCWAFGVVSNLVDQHRRHSLNLKPMGPHTRRHCSKEAHPVGRYDMR